MKTAMVDHGVEQIPTVRLLEAVRMFTAERKRDALVNTLLKTMLEVLPAHAIEFLPKGGAAEEPLRIEHESIPCDDDASRREANLSSMRQDMARWVRAAEAAGERAMPPISVAGSGYTLHPLLDGQGLGGLVGIEQSPGRYIDPAVVDALLRIYRNFAIVIDDSQRDTLTGLLNRKTFEQSIQTVLLDSREQHGAAPDGIEHRRGTSPEDCHWLAVMDIDHFKRINDAFGHLYGDEVLILMSRLMLQSFRKSDRVYRFGGEEFAVLLSPCTEVDVRAVLERFRTAVESHDFPQVGQVTISVGFVAVKAQDIPATVVSHADEALYASKHAGRNRVTGYADLLVHVQPKQSSSVDLF